MEMEIFYASCYTRPERMTQKLSQYMLYLAVSGFEYMDYYDSDYRPQKLAGSSPDKSRPHWQPFLALFPPGSTLKFSAGHNRESWAVILSLPELTLKKDPWEYVFESSVMQPFLIPDTGKLYRLRESFATVAACVAAGHSAGMTKAKLLCSSILADLILLPADDGDPAEKHTPEAALKRAMDQDIHFEHSVGELNRTLNLCSLPHMRKRFLARYGVLPCKYRSNLRMNRILELFSQSDLTLKMIADEVGMLHLEHLYTFLQSRQELSPKALMEQLRGKKLSGEG